MKALKNGNSIKDSILFQLRIKLSKALGAADYKKFHTFGFSNFHQIAVFLLKNFSFLRNASPTFCVVTNASDAGEGKIYTRGNDNTGD